MEVIPRTTVYIQMSGSKMKYERRRLSHPWRWGTAAVEGWGGVAASGSSVVLSISIGVLADGTAS
jgi:hypothetical protein